MEKIIRERLYKAIEEKVFPGCVAGVIGLNGERLVIPVGTFTYDDSPNLTYDSVFDVASVTKAIPVSCLALFLIDNERLSLNDKVIKFIPELQTNYRDEITIRHLLTQTLDFTKPLSKLKNTSPDEILREILSTHFLIPPGKKMTYANATSILLGMCIERVSGKSLDRFADEAFFHPLEMKKTSFLPEVLLQEDIVPTEYDSWRGREVQGEVHDESAFTLRAKIIAGSAGLFSTVPDLLTFLEMIIHKGTYNKKSYFSEMMVKQMSTNQLAEIGDMGGLGWELNQKRYMGYSASDRTVGKTGFTGCVVMADMEKGVGLVILSNYHYPQRKKDTATLNTVRRDIADIVFT